MASQTIIQLRELDANSNSYNPGDYDCILSEPITMKDGDELTLASAFIDTRDVSTTYINIDEDTEINMSFYLYNMNHNGATKFWGNTAAIYAGPRTLGVGNIQDCPVWRSSVAVQDGEPYFLTTASNVSPYVSFITGIKCKPIDSSQIWGGTHIVFSYYDVAETQPVRVCLLKNDVYKLPIKDNSKRRYITVYLPVQPVGTVEYTIDCSVIILTSYSPPDDCDAEIYIDAAEAFTLEDSGVHTADDKSLGSVNTNSSFNNLTDLIGFQVRHLAQPGMPNTNQLVMLPVEQNIRMIIPKGKYIPAQLTKLINDGVVNFPPGEPIGISGANLTPPRDIPTNQDEQRLPFEPAQNKSRIIGGMPTFTQTNFIQQPDIMTFQMTNAQDLASATRDPPQVKIGDSFFCNACPVRTYDASGIEAPLQALNPGTPNLYAGGACFYEGNSRGGQWQRGGGSDSDVVTAVPISAFIGASQFSLDYDTDDNYFKFNYLHTPLYRGTTTATTPSEICNYFVNSAGMVAGGVSAPIPGLPSYQSNPGQDGSPWEGNAAGGLPSIGPLEGYDSKYVGANGGIVFTSLTPASFWTTKLGFDLTPAEQDLTTGEITREGIVSHYQIADIGYCPAVSGIAAKRFGFDGFAWDPNGLASPVTATDFNTASISPQMPMIPFKIGMNSTAAQIGLETAIVKATDETVSKTSVTAWWLVTPQASFSPDSAAPGALPNSRFPSTSPSWTTPGITIVGDNTSAIRAKDPRLLNVADTGYFFVDIDTKMNNRLINGTETKSTIGGIINRYYSVNSFTSAEGSSIVYQHRGEPQLIRSVRVRILNPDMSLADVGDDSTIFLTLTSTEQDNVVPPPVETKDKK